jgi:hypothetical protein
MSELNNKRILVDFRERDECHGKQGIFVTGENKLKAYN